MTRIAFVALFCLTVAAQNARANLLVNGSFETPAIAQGGSALYNPGDLGLTGWTILAQISQGGPGFNCCGYAGLPASNGSNWLDMTGNNDNGTGGISQNVTTIAGHTYQLSLDVGNAYSINDPTFSSGPSGPGATSTIVTKVTGTSGYSDTNSVQTNAFNWETFTHTFVATQSATTLTFTNGDVVGDILNGLDNIVMVDVTPVTPPVTGVPEPETMPLLALGLVSLMAVATRRRRRS